MLIKKTIKFACAVLLYGCALHTHAAIVVIVNPNNKVPLDKNIINKIFLGQTRSFPAAGGEAAPVDQSENSASYNEFAAKVLKRTPSQLKYYWARQIFTGGAIPPKQLESDRAVIEFVKSNPSGIGYVDSDVLENSRKQVKVISIAD